MFCSSSSWLKRCCLQIPGDLNVSLAPLLESIQLSPQIEFLSTGVTDNEREALKTFAELLPAAFQQKLCCLGQPLPPSSFLTQTDLEQRTDRDVKRQTALSCASVCATTLQLRFLFLTLMCFQTFFDATGIF